MKALLITAWLMKTCPPSTTNGRIVWPFKLSMIASRWAISRISPSSPLLPIAMPETTLRPPWFVSTFSVV
ncbi:hypothetical protein D3C79_950650 [compost metagenome]